MPTAQINGINLHYESQGDGPPVLLIHGLGSSAADWSPQVDAMKDRFRCITYDARGHGQSDKPDEGPYFMPQHAADAVALLDHLGIAKVAVVGLSMGGMIAFQMALDAPERMLGMVIINSGPRVKPQTFKEHLAIWQRLILFRMFSMRKIGEVIGKRLFPDENQAALRQEFIESWAKNDKRAYMDATRGLANWNVEPQIATIQVPTLVLAADQDYTSVELKRAYVNKMPHAELVVIDNARHAVNMASPEKVNGLIEEFVARVSEKVPAAG